MQADVFKLTMDHPGDVSALATLIDSGEVRADQIVAFIGKTEGNGGVNDFTRGYFTDRLMTMLSGHLNEPAEVLARRLPCILSGGTEGVLSPHYLVFCRKETDAPGTGALAIGKAFSPVLDHRHVGTRDHALSVAEAVKAAIVDAGIETIEDVHFVQVKAPCLTSERIAGLREKGLPLPATSAGQSMALARAAGAFGVALALGDITSEALTASLFLQDFNHYCDRASVSSGVEVEANEVIVLGNSGKWSGNLRISHRAMEDAIDLAAVQAVLGDLGLSAQSQVNAAERDRIRGVLVKAEPDRSGRIHGQRHTMLNDTDIDPQRHIRGAVGGVVASVVGDTRIFVSGGAEHQGPDGGGLIAVIAENAAGTAPPEQETGV
ncbi:ring-opening amidohydrolase [uncultured Roseibium sp.]|uniref:cyanuric acid amidohydrolase n=1 Tax=uncultured Roseibium sp. TaxID=1936171 RepID=UPI003217E915